MGSKLFPLEKTVFQKEGKAIFTVVSPEIVTIPLLHDYINERNSLQSLSEICQISSSAYWRVILNVCLC